MSEAHLVDCSCLEAGPRRDARTETPLGVDETRGRFGDVATWTCDRCGRNWLRYSVQYEAFSRSGRWFLGVLEPGQSRVHPAAAADALAQLKWYLAGGSHYDGQITRKSGPPDVDLHGGKPGTGAQFVSGDEGRLELEVHAMPDWAGFDALVRLAKEAYGATVLNEADGPTGERAWDLEIDGHKIVLQHIDTRGNTLFAADEAGEPTLLRLGKDLGKRLQGVAPTD